VVLLLSLALLAAPQDSDLGRVIALLDHDDPAVRDRAISALALAGVRVRAVLVAARPSSSVEQRGRIDELLDRLPGAVEAGILRHPQAPLLKKYWDAVFDALREKKPLPGAIWLDLMGRDEVTPPACWDMAEWEHRGSHSADWLAHALAEEARWALVSLTSWAGVEGLEVELDAPPVAEFTLPTDLFDRLVALQPDPITLEETYLTLLQLHGRGLLGRFRRFSARDWDAALGVLVALRRRAAPTPLALPETQEEALRTTASGPWMKGLAHGLGRALAGPGYLSKDRLERTARPPRRSEKAGPLERAYLGLAELEIRLGRRYFYPERLKATRLRLPDAEQQLNECSTECFRDLAKRRWPDADTRRIAFGLAACRHEGSDVLEDTLVAELSARIVTLVRDER
jgi:hypothetical protein